MIDARVLPDEQKRQLCIDLLREFGVTSFRENRDGELTHRCTLGLGGHSDGNSQTASINYKKLVFNCFVCGHGGGLVWWIAVNRKIDRDQVENWIRESAGIGQSMELPQLLSILEAIMHPTHPELEPLSQYDDKILDPWLDWPVQHPYMTEIRRMPEETLKRYQVGYDDDGMYFRRIMIPMRWKGKIVGWQGRGLELGTPEHMARVRDPEDLESEGKYLNSPDFPRDRILYGEIGGQDAVVVESPMSVLRHAHHLPMVSTLGAQITDRQMSLLHRFRRVTLFYDNDQAGYNATYGLIHNLSRHVQLSVVRNPHRDKDPADLEDHEIESLVREAVPAVLWNAEGTHKESRR